MIQDDSEKPLIYLWLQKRIIEKSNEDNEINYKSACQTICQTKFPRKLVQIIIKELEILGLVKIVHRYKVKVVNKEECKKIKESNKLCKEVGFY